VICRVKERRVSLLFSGLSLVNAFGTFESDLVLEGEKDMPEEESWPMVRCDGRELRDVARPKEQAPA